jgi:hypothetical protein
MAVSLLALLISLGGIGLAANGGPFLLGVNNVATTISTLRSSNDGEAVRIRNASTGSSATALSFVVANGKAPFRVNSNTKVAKLNADLLDGLDSTAFVRSTAEGWHYIGKPGEPAFENGWTNYDGAATPISANYQQAAYRLDSFGVVHIRGLVKGGTIGLPFFSLPFSYCPYWNRIFPAISNNAFSRVTVEYNPTPCHVFANFGSNAWVSLEGVSYLQRARDITGMAALTPDDAEAFQPYLERMQHARTLRAEFNIAAEALPHLSRNSAKALAAAIQGGARR